MDRARVVNGVLVVLVWCASAAATSNIKVGSFAKSTSGAPTTQNVAHGLGAPPVAVVLWTEGKTNATSSSNYTWAMGFSDLTTERSVSAASQDVVGTSNASRRIASKAISIVQWGESTLAEASVSAVDATNFTLSWSTNDANATIIHFLAIGGAGTRAKVVGWTTPTATGDKSVTGVGFTPSAVLHLHAGGITTAPPTSTTSAAIGLGAMDGAGNEWSSEILVVDNSGTSDTQRDQVTDAAVVMIDNALSLAVKGAWSSMDTDGFTMAFSAANGSAYQIGSLALAGLRAKVGNFGKSTGAATVAQAVTGVGFRPKAVLFASDLTTAGAGPSTDARLAIGATDGTTQGAGVFSDDDAQDTTDVEAVDSTSKSFIKVNNSTQTINAQCTTTSLDDGGFTLSWTTNDAVATEIGYVALAPRRVMLTSRAE